MLTRLFSALISWFKRLFGRGSRPALPREIDDAQKLIAAIDAGGVPLNPAKINQIAINLGLEVSRKAKQEETIARIRAALGRVSR